MKSLLNASRSTHRMTLAELRERTDEVCTSACRAAAVQDRARTAAIGNRF
ncbi:hypothetical protein [Spirillospora sp. CA-294931]